jgi:AraC-like DNA-binding protein
MHESPNLGLRALYGGYYQAGKGAKFPQHQHPEWELVYYQEGRIECVHGPRRFLSQAGTLWLTPPQTPHAEIALTRYRNIYISVVAPASVAWPIHVADDADRNLGRLCDAIVKELQPDTGRDEILIQLMLQELSRRVARASLGEKPGTSANLVQRTEALFFTSLDQPVSIADTARRLGASPSKLRQAFQDVRGESPRACLRRLRCQQALHWLQNSTHSLETIAALCGFDSASHLSRVIYQEIGQRPGKLRKSRPT